MCKRGVLMRGCIGINYVKRPFHDDASPVEDSLALVDLKRDPSVVSDAREFCPIARTPVNPTMSIDVVNGRDVHMIVQGVGDTPNLMPLQEALAFIATEFPKVWRPACVIRFLRGHDLISHSVVGPWLHVSAGA